MKQFTILLLFLFSISLGLLSCSRQEFSQEVIARVGKRTIDWRLIQRSYQLNPKWGKGLTNKEAYFNQLDFLISQKLYAQAAEEAGLDREEDVRGYLTFLEEKELIKELYRREVAAKVNISEEEYQRAYRNSKRQVTFHYLITPDSARAFAYYRTLHRVPFQKLKLGVPRKDRKGTTGLLRFGEMDPAIEAFVFDLKPGELAPPVKTRKGWMVIQLVNGVVDKFMSELDFAEQKSKIRKVLFDRKASVIANRYIKDLMRDKDLRLNPPVFFALSRAFSEIVQNKYSEQPIPVFVSNQEVRQTGHRLKDLRDSVLITYRDGQMTVEDFLRYLSNLPNGLRPRVKMQRELKDAIGVAVRNHYLAERARRRGLAKSPRMRYEIAAQRDAFLARYWLKRQRDHLNVSPAEIAQFRRKKKFREIEQRSGRRWSDSEVADLILDYKFALRKVFLADSLRKWYPVQVDSELFLQKIPHPNRLIQNDPIRFVVRELFN